MERAQLSSEGTQKASTLRFWDDFYASQEQNDCSSELKKEWIAQPSEGLFDTVLRASATSPTHVSCDNNTNRFPPRRILEIGCGTSTLARDFYHFLKQQFPSQKFHVVATDVSEICIQQMLRRDDAHLRSTKDNVDKNVEGLEYVVWNVTHPPPGNFVDYFDLILDKGCLDTILFRSRNRGPRRFALMDTFLINVASCLRQATATDGNCASRYLCISPRRKIKALRDGTRFQYTQPPQPFQRQNGDLEGDAERTMYYLHSCSST